MREITLDFGKDGQEEEEDGFVVPDGYLSSDEIIYFDSADAADEEETSRGDLQDNSGEETNVRSIAELNALHQFISVAEKAKQHNKPIVITDEAILQVQNLVVGTHTFMHVVAILIR